MKIAYMRIINNIIGNLTRMDCVSTFRWNKIKIVDWLLPGRSWSVPGVPTLVWGTRPFLVIGTLGWHPPSRSDNLILLYVEEKSPAIRVFEVVLCRYY